MYQNLRLLRDWRVRPFCKLEVPLFSVTCERRRFGPLTFSCEGSPAERKFYAFLLAVCWFAGLVCGFLVFLGTGDSVFRLMRSAPLGSVSFVGLLICSLLPFLISAFAVFLSRSVLLAFSFGKAFLFSFTAAGIARAYGDAGWLVCRMAMFSSFTLLPLLYFLWLRLLSGRMRWTGVFLLLALAMLIVSVDYRIISPFWASLIEIQKG